MNVWAPHGKSASAKYTLYVSLSDRKARCPIALAKRTLALSSFCKGRDIDGSWQKRITKMRINTSDCCIVLWDPPNRRRKSFTACLFLGNIRGERKMLSTTSLPRRITYLIFWRENGGNAKNNATAREGECWTLCTISFEPTTCFFGGCEKKDAVCTI